MEKKPRPLPPITPRQQEVLVYLRWYIKEHGIAPSRDELQKAMGWASRTSALTFLRKLERRGYLTLSRKHRGIRLTAKRVPDSSPP